MIIQITSLMIFLQILSGCGDNVDVCNKLENTSKSKRGGKEKKFGIIFLGDSKNREEVKKYLTVNNKDIPSVDNKYISDIKELNTNIESLKKQKVDYIHIFGGENIKNINKFVDQISKDNKIPIIISKICYFKNYKKGCIQLTITKTKKAFTEKIKQITQLDKNKNVYNYELKLFQKLSDDNVLIKF